MEMETETINIIITVNIGVVIGILITYMWLKYIIKNKFAHIEIEAKARAKALKSEADLILKEAKINVKEIMLEQKQKNRDSLKDIEEKERKLILKTKDIEKEKTKIKKIEESLLNKEKVLDSLTQKKEEEIDTLLKKMENISSYTKEEAKNHILELVEEKSRAEIANIIRRYEHRAKEEAKAKANYIIAQATTRYAGDFAGERLTNTIKLPSDEHKGRIIGKEGRNIKALETILGVDVIIDDTPESIIVSSFNLYRRAIATRVIELLVNDGRINPVQIEEYSTQVTNVFEKQSFTEGENILLELGVFPMPDELVKLLGRMKYRASYGQNALAHTLEVAKLSRVMASELGGDEKLAMRAGLLHDIGKALTDDMGGSHVDIGVELCKKHNEHPTVINAIYAHHGHEEPDSIESAVVCAADKLSAARPGARREVLESFTKRVKEIEHIALENSSVKQAYAVDGGREIRVIVQANKINDNEIVLLSKDIADKIEARVQYPGEIKVNVIREVRAINYAK